MSSDSDTPIPDTATLWLPVQLITTLNRVIPSLTEELHPGQSRDALNSLHNYLVQAENNVNISRISLLSDDQQTAGEPSDHPSPSSSANLVPSASNLRSSSLPPSKTTLNISASSTSTLCEQAKDNTKAQLPQPPLSLSPRLSQPGLDPYLLRQSPTEICVGHFVRCISHLYSTKLRSSFNQVDFDKRLGSSDNHDGSNERGNLKRLPTEILQGIFSIALPSSVFLNPSLYRGPDSPWCQAVRFKKALIQVCRAWWHAAVHLLYNEVVIRRVGQIAALIRTLESPQNDLQILVKTVAFICYIPENYISYSETAIQRLLNLCPSICATCIHAPTHDLSYFASNDSKPMQPSLRSFCAPIPQFLTHLEYGDYSWAHLTQVLSLCKTLKSLSVRSPCAEEFAGFPYCLVLDQLDQLKCELRSSFGLLRAMADKWSLPRLKQFTLVFLDKPTHDDHDDLVRFCRTHGHDLRYLHINPGLTIRKSLYAFRLQTILGACHNLVHLVYPDPSDLVDIHAPLHHATLMWIDVWARCEPVDGQSQRCANFVETFSASCKSSLPSMKAIRILDSDLAYMSYLPIQLPPDPNLDNHMHIQYPGLSLHVTKSIIAQHASRYVTEFRDVFDAEGQNETDGDEGSYLDSDYEPIDEEDEYDDTSDYAASSDDGSSSSSSSEGDLSDYEESGETMGEVDHDAVLAIFTGTLRG